MNTKGYLYNNDPQAQQQAQHPLPQQLFKSKKSKKNKQPQNLPDPIGLYVGKSQYMITKYLSEGSYGRLYLGIHVERKIEVAIKIEPINCEKPQLHLEYGFYKRLTLRKGVPKIYTFGPCGVYNALVMELLGPNLEHMLSLCGGRLSLRSVVQLTIQFLFLFRGIHDCGILYRDVKPENFLLGLPNTNKYWLVHVIDLGFCKQWRQDDGTHIPYQENKPLTGTVRYMSINNNLGREQSRRDDLEALTYMLIYLYRGRLPWQGIQASTLPERYMKICQCKISTPIEQLCQYLPEEYERMLRNIRGLQFEERPNYNGMIQMFTNLLLREYLLEKNDRQIYDWTSDHKIRSSFLKSINTTGSWSSTNDQSTTTKRRSTPPLKSVKRHPKSATMAADAEAEVTSLLSANNSNNSSMSPADYSYSPKRNKKKSPFKNINKTNKRPYDNYP